TADTVECPSRAHHLRPASLQAGHPLGGGPRHAESNGKAPAPVCVRGQTVRSGIELPGVLLAPRQTIAEGCLGDHMMDVVPNYMGISDASNQWWHDVLENGPGSPYAHFFDIDWAPPKAVLANKVLLPVLGDQYGKVLEQGDIRLCYDERAFAIACADRHLPVAPRTWIAILAPALEHMGAALAADDPDLIELESIIT